MMNKSISIHSYRNSMEPFGLVDMSICLNH
ncbi:hypothetical protein BLA29_014087 [Euroglyphus maynei]|uniref:Uncharacterized protein n=1 Tax=Euroglyphus maynei TaxID=6958 RepID=A0A1Y3AZA1_EURMA|nr:hypothetical protein BLA29_014087 [Euroglyphus maynei]